MPEKLRAGVIGCGFTINHVRGYLNSGRYEVVALADLSEEAMARVDGECGISPRHYGDGRAMLETEDLDVVSIGVWPSHHAEWTVAAAARRPQAIVCEKPMAASLQGAEQMLVAAQRNGVKLIIGHQRRFLPAFGLARKLIGDGAIGQVQLIQTFASDGFPNKCSHQADYFRYLLGDDECEWVMGNVERKTDRWERGTRIEDSGIAVFQFRGGARALILNDVTTSWYHGGHIYGSEGMIDLTITEVRLLNGETGGRWKSYRPDGKFFKLDEVGDRFEWLEAPAAQMAELADWVEGKAETHRGRAQNGYKALEMIHAIYESARCHEKVVLPLQTRLSPLNLMVESGHLEPERPGRYDVRATQLHGEDTYTHDTR